MIGKNLDHNNHNYGNDSDISDIGYNLQYKLTLMIFLYDLG